MIRVLHVISDMGIGGNESFLMNCYRTIDREQVQFDFLLRGTKSNQEVLDEIARLGGRVYYTPCFPQRIGGNSRELTEFFREHDEFEAVHIHAQSMVYTAPIKAAWQTGVPVRIIQCHGRSSSMRNPLLSLLHKKNRRAASEYANVLLAGSMEAGEWMFGDTDFSVVHNAIDVDAFDYDWEKREEMRRRLGLEDSFVVGSVGRLTLHKNQEFMLQVFAELTSREPNAVLLLIGEGPMRRELESAAAALGIDGKVRFVGVCPSVSDMMQAMDAYLCTSLFEEHPTALYEAQAAGLFCIVPDVVRDDAVVTWGVERLSLNAPLGDWAEALLRHRGEERYESHWELCNAGYDIRTEAGVLQELYIGSTRRDNTA